MRRLAAILTFLMSFSAGAQDIYVEVSKDEVALNEQFTYSIIAHKKCDVIPPDFEGFKASGPNYGEQYSSSNYGGSMKSVQIFTFTWTLWPTGVGIYTIKAAQLDCGKKSGVEKSEEVKITVVNDQQLVSTKAGTAPFFITLVSNKVAVRQGEAFTLCLKYYSKSKPNSIEAIENGIADGLWRQDLKPAEEAYTMTKESINGTSYFVIELRRELCIPLRAGKINIPPSYASLVFQQDIFNQYRQDGYSNGLEITVLPLPDDLPDDFNGLVGSFELDDNVDRQRVNAGQAVELNISISGCGNFNAFDPPDVELPESFKSQDPTYKEEIRNTPRGIEGTVEFTFSFTPTEEGEYTIDPYHFSYYDLQSGEVKSHQTKELVIDVKPRTGGDVVIEKFKDEELQLGQNDIHYIRDQNEELFTAGDLFFGTFAYTIVVSAPVLFSVFFVFLRLKKRNLSEAEREASRKKHARKSALKELAIAEAWLAKGNQTESLKALRSALEGYFMTKLNLSLSEISKSGVSEKMKSGGVDEATVIAFESLWVQVEMAQFAPSASSDHVALLKQAGHLIELINSEMK